MKYDLSKNTTKGAMRTLNSFKDSMFTLLSTKSFEEITVGELCNLSNYPRATFYNYFDDKYDLLGYCWIRLTQEIHLEEYRHIEQNQMLYTFYNRIDTFTKEHHEKIRLVLSHNLEVGYMFSSFRNFLNQQMRIIFKDCSDANNIPLPRDILADHYSNTLLLVWQYCNLINPNCTKEDAYKYLDYLVGKLY